MAKPISRKVPKERRPVDGASGGGQPDKANSKGWPPRGWTIHREGFRQFRSLNCATGGRGPLRDTYDEAMRDAEAAAYGYPMGS